MLIGVPILLYMYVCLFVWTLAPDGDTLGSWWDQTQTKCSSQALKSKYAGLVVCGNKG